MQPLIHLVLRSNCDMDVLRFRLYLIIRGIWLSTVTWFLDLQRCTIILTQFDANRWPGSLPIKQHRGRTAASVAVTQCYALMQVLFLPGWSTVLLLLFFLANILKSRSVVSVSKIGAESKWWNSSILIWLLLPYSIRPSGLLTLWWPARLLPWRLSFSLCPQTEAALIVGAWVEKTDCGLNKETQREL